VVTAGYWLGCFISLLVHEAAHVCTGAVFGLRVKRVGITWRGPYIVREQGDALANVIVSAAGPLANVVLAVATWRLSASFGLANLVLGLANLWPTRNSDGGRIISELARLRRSTANVPAASDESEPQVPLPGVSLRV